MNAKPVIDITQKHQCVSEKLLNPFVHHLELETTYEKIKTAILTIVLLPIRVFIICCFLIAGWFVACIGLWGLTEEDIMEKPLTGWRRKLVRVICFLGKSVYWAGGMHLVVKGKQATREEAPILVVAPHSTFLDGGIVYATGSPSIIVGRGNDNPYVLNILDIIDVILAIDKDHNLIETTIAIPFNKKLINFTQPVYVWREDSDSRQTTIKEIIRRATSKEDWPQVLIFPEGTCTNRSCLITFKPGAFYPGVPIQPVCIRYPNKLDTVTWTWDGPGAFKLLWLTLTQPYSCCEIEFLPVYVPNEEEKKDPKLYATNVRQVMAKALGVPVLDYTYDDCKLMSRAKEMNLPNATALVEVQKLRHSLGLANTNTEELLLNKNGICKDFDKISYPDFVTLLNIPAQEISSQQLFNIYNKDGSGLIDLRKYLLGVLALSNNRSTIEVVKLAFKIYDQSGFGRLSLQDFCNVVCHTLAFNEDIANDIFHQVDSNHLEYITLGSFLSFAERNAELADALGLTKEEKFFPKHEQFCPDEYHGKKRD